MKQDTLKKEEKMDSLIQNKKINIFMYWNPKNMIEWPSSVNLPNDVKSFIQKKIEILEGR